MFATISNISLTVEGQKYVIALGYDLPDDKKIEEIEGTPQLGFTIQKQISETEFEPVQKPENDEPDSIFNKLSITAHVYSKGFVDGVTYYNAVYGSNEEQVANDNKIITE